MKIILIIFLSIIIFPIFAPSHPEYVGVEPPLKQIKAGVPLVDVICNEGKIPAYKYNAMSVACVSSETESQLVVRGWALLRLHMYDDDPLRALCERYGGNWLEEHRECEYISQQQCSLMGGKFSECESPCRYDPTAEICTLQCVLVCSVEGIHFPEFSLSYSREGGIAGISQNISIDTINHLIKISGFNSKTLGPISTENMQRLWEVISENQFFELDSTTYPPVEGSADYFTYTLDVVTSPQRNAISWTDTSSEFPREIIVITQEIDRQIQFYSTVSKTEIEPESEPEPIIPEGELEQDGITYTIRNYYSSTTAPISIEDQEAAVQQAFEHWTQHIDAEAIFVKNADPNNVFCTVNISSNRNIGTGGGNGPNTWCVVNIGSNQRLYVGEKPDSTFIYRSLLAIAAHEGGHGLGLGHQNIGNCMMFTNYGDGLRQCDTEIKELQELWGGN